PVWCRHSAGCIGVRAYARSKICGVPGPPRRIPDRFGHHRPLGPDQGGLPRGPSRLANVPHRDPGEMTLTGEIKDHTKLGDLISERVADFLLPDALRRLEEGQRLGFGPVAISRAGLTVHSQQAPWQQIVTLSFGLNPYPVKGTFRHSNMIHLRISPA